MRSSEPDAQPQRVGSVVTRVMFHRCGRFNSSNLGVEPPRVTTGDVTTDKSAKADGDIVDSVVGTGDDSPLAKDGGVAVRTGNQGFTVIAQPGSNLNFGATPPPIGSESATSAEGDQRPLDSQDVAAGLTPTRRALLRTQLAISFIGLGRTGAAEKELKGVVDELTEELGGSEES